MQHVIWKVPINLNYQVNVASIKSTIYLHRVLEWELKIAEHGDTEVPQKYSACKCT